MSSCHNSTHTHTHWAKATSSENWPVANVAIVPRARESITGIPRLKETKHYCAWVDEVPTIVYHRSRHGFLEGTPQPKRKALAVASSSSWGFQSVIK